MCYKNRKLVTNEPYSTSVRAYIACQLEFENSMKLLVERLDKAGTLQNTVFVISTDHYPYGLTTEEYSELFGHPLEENFELYKNGLIIYKPGMTPQVVDELCYSVDVLPTISNMFGLEFDSRLYMGRDIFSEKAPLIVFNNSSWITDRGSYNAITGKAVANDGSALPQDYVDRINNEVSNRFAVSTRILDHDYWRALFK
jgi:phosphoglycerol transferase MdoB-like AlkP superfamily enzyme